MDTDKYDYILTYSFPCITNDSLILTKKGYIEMKDVKVGDYVLTKSNTWQKVDKKFDNGIHQTCYLDAMGFENIHCTLNHKFYVRQKYKQWDNNIRKYVRKFKEPQFKETKDLTKNDYLGVPIIKNEIPFYSNDLDFWYMIGMYLGDGWLPKNDNDIVIACNEKKLELLKNNLNKEKYNYTYHWCETCYRFRFANKDVRKFIEKYIGTGSDKKNIPYEILCLPKPQLESLYKGYLDSDGCKIGNIRQFTSINRSLIYSMSLIINKLFCLPTRIYKVKVSPKKIIDGRIVNQKDWYQLRFKTTIDKQDKAFFEGEYIWYPFNKITLDKKEHVYNMEIENDHSYIIQGCISKNCQDLSLAGKGKGMKKDSGTRSGMLWEVERILDELEEKPQILLMENVPQVIGTNSIKDFQDWELKLESLGYSNYVEVLNAKDFGIPQNRERCFMISILGEYNYTFPQKEKLKLRLKDLLENEVDEKFYLSDKQINQIMYWNSQQEPFETLDKEICPTLTTRSGAYAGGMVLTSENEEKDLGKKLMNLKTQLCNEIVKSGKVKEMVVVYDDYNSSIRKDQDTIGTITTNIGNNAPRNGYKIIENIVKIGNYSPSGHNAASVVDSNGISPTVMDNTPKVIGGLGEMKSNVYILSDNMKKYIVSSNSKYKVNSNNLKLNRDIACAKTTREGWTRADVSDYLSIDLPQNYQLTFNQDLTNLRIRKLTPKECFRLMGVKDEDYENIAKNQSNASLYHLAGDSIVTATLMAMFSQLLDIDWRDKLWFKPKS